MDVQKSPERRSDRNASGWFSRALVVLGAVLFCVVLAEGFLWLFLPIPLEAGDASRQVTQHLPGLTENITYETNAFGFRALSMEQREKPPGTLRVFCIGASTTNQTTQNTEDMWCGMLERKLTDVFEAEGVRVETVAFGQGGLKARGLLRWARRNLLPFEPDLVITLMGVNDLSFNGGPGYAYTGLDDLPAAGRGRRSFASQLEKVSQISRRIAVAADRVTNGWRLATGKAVQWHSENLPRLRRAYQAYPYVAVPVREPDPIHEFTDAMAALLTFLNEANVKTMVLGQPVLWKEEMTDEEAQALWFYVNTSQGRVRPSSRWLVQEMTRYNKVQETLAQRMGAGYLDLDQRIPKTRAYFFDDCHFTDRGSGRVASAIFPLVREQVQLLLEAQAEAEP